MRMDGWKKMWLKVNIIKYIYIYIFMICSYWDRSVFIKIEHLEVSFWFQVLIQKHNGCMELNCILLLDGANQMWTFKDSHWLGCRQWKFIPRNFQQDPLNGPQTWVSNSSIATYLGVRWEGPIQFLMNLWDRFFCWIISRCYLQLRVSLVVDESKRWINLSDVSQTVYSFPGESWKNENGFSQVWTNYSDLGPQKLAFWEGSPRLFQGNLLPVFVRFSMN